MMSCFHFEYTIWEQYLCCHSVVFTGHTRRRNVAGKTLQWSVSPLRFNEPAAVGDNQVFRATIVVCAKSGTEVPRYGVCVSPTILICLLDPPFPRFVALQFCNRSDGDLRVGQADHFFQVGGGQLHLITDLSRTDADRLLLFGSDIHRGFEKLLHADGRAAAVDVPGQG